MSEAVEIITIDKTPRCSNGWRGKDGRSCNYTGGHFCERTPPNHEGRCRCECGATSTRREAQK